VLNRRLENGELYVSTVVHCLNMSVFFLLYKKIMSDNSDTEPRRRYPRRNRRPPLRLNVVLDPNNELTHYEYVRETVDLESNGEAEVSDEMAVEEAGSEDEEEEEEEGSEVDEEMDEDFIVDDTGHQLVDSDSEYNPEEEEESDEELVDDDEVEEEVSLEDDADDENEEEEDEEDTTDLGETTQTETDGEERPRYNRRPDGRIVFNLKKL